jgi:hypothetical protein
MTERRFVLVDFRYTSDPLGHVRFYEAGNSYDMSRALAHAAAKRELVAVEQPARAEPAAVKRRSPKHRSIRHGQSQPAPGIREQPRLKRTRTVQDFLQRKLILEPHSAGRKSLL